MTYHQFDPNEFTKSGLHPTIGPVISMERREGETVWSMIEEHNVPVDQCPTICTINGEPILRNKWHDVLDINDVVIFVSIPQGDIFKQLLSLVATIALAVVAPWAAGIIAGFLGVTSSLGLALIQGGIIIAGSFLINAIFNPKPKEDESKTPSPTYSVNAQGNSARLYQTIPKMYGNHIIYPDFIANPYGEFVANQQVVYQVFGQGLGKYQTHKVRIEETDLWDEITGINPDFTQVEIQFCEPGEPITLFHTRVQTSSEVAGNDMRNSYVNYQGVTFYPDGKIKAKNDETFPFILPGDKVQVTGTFAGIYTVLSIATNNRWIIVNHSFSPQTTTDAAVLIADETRWVGPYESNDANTITNKIQCDFYCPKGIFEADKKGNIKTASVSIEVQVMLIDTAGISLGSWYTVGIHTFTHATVTPQRYTETYEVDDGRYKVRVRRINTESYDTKNVSSIQWAGLKAFIPDDNTYADISTVAIKMVTTGQLTQQASRRFNIIQTAILPVYDAGTETWSDEPTRSIAWAAYDIITNEDYGCKFDPSTVDLTKLAYLDGVWTARGDNFDAVFDSVYSAWDAISACLRAGRTLPVLIGGVLTFRRREDQIVPKGIFTPNNIMRNSFETEHMLFTDDSADDIIIEFVDRRTWKLNEVRCVVAESSSLKPERQQLFGVTDRLHAWREGIFAAAFNARNRIVAKITTELDGRLLVRGDLVYAAHDLYDWGQTGQVDFYIPDSKELYLDRDIQVTPSSYIMLRKRNGEGWGPVKINQGSQSNIVVFDATDLTAIEGDQGAVSTVWALDDDLIPTKFIIAEQTADYKRFTVVSGTPNDDKVDLVLIYDDPTVHAEDQGTPPSETYPYEPGSNRPVIATLTGVKTVGSSMGAPDVKFDWTAAVPTATNGYILQISYDNYSWETIYTGPLLTYTKAVYPGLLYYRVRGISAIIGIWKKDSGTFGTASTLPLPIADVDISSAEDASDLTISWTPSLRATSYGIKVYTESVIGSAVYDTLETTVTTIEQFYLFTEDAMQALGGPWPNIKVEVYGINSSGNGPATIAFLGNEDLPAVSNLAFVTPYASADIQATWDAVANATSYTVKLYNDSMVLVYTTSVINPEVLITSAFAQTLGGPWPSVTIEVIPINGTISGPQTQITGPEVLYRLTEDGSFRLTESNANRIGE